MNIGKTDDFDIIHHHLINSCWYYVMQQKGCWFVQAGQTFHNRTLCSIQKGERGGSVVECRTPEREVRGSRPTSAVLCPWARHFTPRKYWLITQEAMAPSRHDWKIVDWDVKPQHNQPTIQKNSTSFETTVNGNAWHLSRYLYIYLSGTSTLLYAFVFSVF